MPSKVRRIVSVTHDDNVSIWNIDTGSCTQLNSSLASNTWRVAIGYMKEPLTCIAVSDDGSRVACGYLYGTIRVWGIDSANRMFTSFKGVDPVEAMSFLGARGSLVSCSSSTDGAQIRTWNLHMTGKRHARLYTEDMFSKAVFTMDGTQVFSGYKDGSLRTWDVLSGRQFGTPLLGHIGEVTDLTVSSDCCRVVSVSTHWDKTIRIWDIRTRKQLLALRVYASELAVVQADDKRYLDPTMIEIWDVRDAHRDCFTLPGETRYVEDVFVSSDGLRIISVARSEGDVNDEVSVWDIQTRRRLKLMTMKGVPSLKKSVLELVSEAVEETSALFSLSGLNIIHGRGGNASVIGTMEARAAVWALSPDEKTIFAGLQDGRGAFMMLEIPDVDATREHTRR